MKYCPECAEPLTETIPEGDDRPRKTCLACGAIHYRNPVAVVGCIVERGQEILLCRRAIEPSHGRWTLPAGYLEVGEAARDGARRETLEEACAQVEIVAPHSQFDLVSLGQTYSFFRARLERPQVEPGPESLEVAFVGPDEIPWDELAFPVVHVALELWVEDLRARASHLHLGTLRWRRSGSRFDRSEWDLEDHMRVRLP